tara:strand:+ start:277312 stop:277923 length:612 start_codon:yes stop_codon:yes gene_type:complete
MTTKTLHWTPSTQSITDESGSVVAQVSQTDIMGLAESWPTDLDAKTLIVPCGQHLGVDPEPSAQLLARWSQDSWEPFNEAVTQVQQLATDAGIELILLPGAGGRLSDAICTLSWSAAHPDIPLLIDPARWLTPSMLTDLTDHLIRSTSLCEELPNIWAVSVRSIESDTQGQLVHSPIGEGLIIPELLDRTIRTIPSPRWIECR